MKETIKPSMASVDLLFVRCYNHIFLTLSIYQSDNLSPGTNLHERSATDKYGPRTVFVDLDDVNTSFGC